MLNHLNINVYLRKGNGLPVPEDNEGWITPGIEC